MSQAQYNLQTQLNYRQLIETIDYFQDSSELVPFGSLIGDPLSNCSKKEFQNNLIEVLEKYSEAFEILRAT